MHIEYEKYVNDLDEVAYHEYDCEVQTEADFAVLLSFLAPHLDQEPLSCFWDCTVFGCSRDKPTRKMDSSLEHGDKEVHSNMHRCPIFDTHRQILYTMGCQIRNWKYQV